MYPIRPLASSAMIVQGKGESCLMARPSSVNTSPGQRDPGELCAEGDHLNLDLERPSIACRDIEHLEGACTISMNGGCLEASPFMRATVAWAFSTSPGLSSGSGKLTVVLLTRSGAGSRGASRGHASQDLASQDCAHSRGVAKAPLRFFPVNVDVIDVAATAGGEERDHLGTFIVSQAAAQGCGHVGRDDGLTDVIEMDGVVDVGRHGLVGSSFEEDDGHVRVNCAGWLQDQRVTFPRIPADRAVFHMKTAVEGDRAFAAPGRVDGHALKSRFGLPNGLGDLGGQACAKAFHQLRLAAEGTFGINDRAGMRVRGADHHAGAAHAANAVDRSTCVFDKITRRGDQVECD